VIKPRKDSQWIKPAGHSPDRPDLLSAGQTPPSSLIDTRLVWLVGKFAGSGLIEKQMT
jgi:hypothetical protein